MGVLMELCLGFLRENSNKFCFIEFVTVCLNLKKIIEKRKPEALSYLQKNIACMRFYQHKCGFLTFQPTKNNQNRSLKYTHFTDFLFIKI